MSKIAIVGMSCLFPGASSVDAFWEVLKNSKDCRENARDEDFGIPVDSCYSDVPGENKIYSLNGGFIRDFQFNEQGINLPPEMLKDLDDVFKWPLHVAKEAIADAGLTADQSALSRAGMIMGNYAFPTKQSNKQALPIWYAKIRQHLAEHLNMSLPELDSDKQLPSGLNRFVCGLPTSVTARAFNMNGPVFALDAACASALYAIKMSSYYLRSGQADVMLAGGICAPDPWLIHTSFSDLRAYPEDGFSLPFSNRSSGIQTGQGAGLVVLKRLDDAIANGDRIYCTIEGLGISNDGAGKHLLSPNPQGQTTAYERAYQESNVGLDKIDYIECHATGTPLGDKTELNSLEGFFKDEMQHIKLGSVKGMTGHLLTVAGLTSLLKLILSLREKQLVPTTGLSPETCRTSESGALNFNSILNEPLPWPEKEDNRFAAVSAFGFGGTNAHLVLSDQFNDVQKATPEAIQDVAIVGLGAHFGRCEDVSALERLLFEGNTALEKVDPNDFHSLMDAPTDKRSFVNTLDIEPLAFRIPPAELNHFNPQQLLMLKVAAAALEDAGIERKADTERNIAVLLVMDLDIASHLRRAKGELPHYLEKLLSSVGLRPEDVDFDDIVKECGSALHSDIESNEVLSYIGNIMASRISSLWNFNGASFTLSGDGNAVNRAIDVARMMLSAGDCESVLVGAVDLCCAVEEAELTERLEQSQDHLWNNDFNFGSGEGAGAIVLMKDKDARQEQKRRYATIAADTNNTELSQAGLVQLAGLVNEQTLAPELTHVENKTDAAAVNNLYGQLGYMRIAAPIAGIISATLSIYHRYIPAQPSKNKAFLKALTTSLDNDKYYRPPESYPWLKNTNEQRIALVTTSSFEGGLDELLLVEADWPEQNEVLHKELKVIPLIANSLQHLAEQSEHIISNQQTKQFAEFKASCWHSYVNNDKPKVVVSLVANNHKELLKEVTQLQKFLSGEMKSDWKTPKGSYLALTPCQGDVAFVYPGGFNSYPMLANGLMRLFPSLFKQFEQDVENVPLALSEKWIYPRSLTPITSRQLMTREMDMLQDIPAMLTNGTSLAILYTRIFRDVFNIKPKAALGYSLGESSMLFSHGVWPAKGRSYSQLAQSPLFQNALTGKYQVIRDKWQLSDQLENEQVWSSSVLMENVNTVTSVIGNYERLYITHINSPTELLVAGCPTQLKQLIDELGCPFVTPPTSHVLHAEAMSDVKDDLALLNSYPCQPPINNIQLISAGHYDVHKVFEQDHMAALNADSLCREVDFPRLIGKAVEQGTDVFIEVGPGGTCARWVNETLKDNNIHSLSVTQRGKNDLANFEAILARLMSIQAPIDRTGFASLGESSSAKRSVSVSLKGNTRQLDFSQISKQISKIDKADVTPINVAESAENSSQNINSTNTENFIDGNNEVAYWSLNPEYALQLVANGSNHALITNNTQQSVSVTPHIAPTQESAKLTSTPPTTSAPSSSPVSESIAHIDTPERTSMSTRNSKMQQTSSTNSSLAASNEQVKRALQQITDTQHVFQQTQSDLTQLIFNQLNQAVDNVPSVIKSHQSNVIALPEVSHSVAPTTPTNADANQVVTALAKANAQSEVSNSVIQKSNAPFMELAQLKAFADGKIADAFGPRYAEIDNYPVRVRLPSDPYFFVSRVTRMEAEFGKYEPCMLTTEYDIPEDAWYLVNGVMPPGVAVEAGQSDLLLISYLGVDFENKGERMYRLLDGKLKFVGDLPRAGETLRFDIRITSYIRQGDILLFFFSYEGYVNDKLALVLERGCAGFFSQEQLAQGQGALLPEAVSSASLVKPVYHTQRTSLNKGDLVALSQGKLDQVFGEKCQQPNALGVKLPPEKILMIDEVTVLHERKTSGALRMEALKTLDPQGWYFKAHFVDDHVLPGSLVAEGATQVLKVYLLSIGLHQSFSEAEFQPIADLLMDIKVRGQITPDIKQLRYEIEIFDSGFVPRPYVIANVVVYDEDRPLVSVENLGLCLKEAPGAVAYPRYGQADYFSGRMLEDGSQATLTEFHLAHAAKGDLKTAMGQEFDIYGLEHRAPHIPNGDFQFVDRALRLTGDRGKYQNGSIMVTEYDVPADAWYFQQNSYPSIPNCVYLESALQASILLGYFLGVTLEFPDKELAIRNLDGKAVYLKDIDLRGKTIRHKETLLSTNLHNGSVLQNFSFELTADGEMFYQGESLFGYFPPEALENQLGMDKGVVKQFWYEEQADNLPDVKTYALEDETKSGLFDVNPQRPFYRLANQQLNLLHTASLYAEGGRYGKGYVHGYREIRDTDWYFTCHFHRDPVMPGSLGLEAFVQAIQLYAIENKLGVDKFTSPRFGIATDIENNWKYRGQLLKTDPDMNIEIHIKEIRNEAERIVVIADCDLFKDHLRIYQVDNMAIAISEGA